MRHWLQLATRNWRTRPARSLLAVLAITLGVGVVVWVTCCYESVRRGVNEVVLQWIGRSHITIESTAGVWGLFDENVADLVRDLPGVEAVTTRTREYAQAAPPPEAGADPPADRDYIVIEISGVVPENEARFRTHKVVAGRFLRPDDSNAAVIERLLARQFNLTVGDSFYVRHNKPPQPARRLKVVGIVDRRRASMNQAMMIWANLETVQKLCKLPGAVKGVDLILADEGVENIRRVAGRIREVLDRRGGELKQVGGLAPDLQVKTTEAQRKKLGAAQGLLQFIMMLLSCVVLLTAFFIILATMSMGVTERITELGLLRCVGVTRWQSAGLVLVQTIPLGLLGTILGLPLGLGLQWLTIRLVPEYLGQFAYSPWGIALAVAGGIGTTLLGAAAPALRALEVSPVEATRTAGDPRIRRWVWLFGAVGLVLLGSYEIILRGMTGRDTTFFDVQAIAGIILLYLGAAMLVPVVVVALGRAAVTLVARGLGLRPELLGDEVAKAPFRSAAICSGLMVGLSLIVGLVVWGKSVKQGWQFPKEFPDALLYSYVPTPLDRARSLRNIEGVKAFTVTDDFAFSLKPPSNNRLLRMFSGLDQFSRFLAIDPEEGLAIVKLAFLEGNERDGLEKLKRGNHIFVTREFAQAQKKELGDKVTIWVQTDKDRFKKATFTIAGVVASPGLDIAMSFFQADTYFQTYAVGAIIGTLDDAKRKFGRNYGKLILFNFDLPGEERARIDSDSSETIAGPTRPGPSGRPTFALGPGPVPGDGPEERIVNAMLKKLGYPPKAFVTARELKQQIDSNINRVTLLLSAIPLVGLLIAALGLGNLMAANVASRSREMAVLRAIGITRNQMYRMVIGEALVLAVLGSAMGLALGLALGRTSNATTELLSGFRPSFAIPWNLVGYGAGLATLLCVLAALVPARHASRSNIVDALSDG
ncbi:MAG: FtsX-like permease family protein [Phycisphaerae bacterium]